MYHLADITRDDVRYASLCNATRLFSYRNCYRHIQHFEKLDSRIRCDKCYNLIPEYERRWARYNES